VCGEWKVTNDCALDAYGEGKRDALPILLQFTVFGSKWYSDVVFEDKTSRKLDELFQPNAMKVI